MSWATWLLFAGVSAPCVALRARCPGSLGSCSPVFLLGLLFCLCGVLGHLAPVHGCACAVRCVVSAVSWVTWLLFTGVSARCVVLRVWRPGTLGPRSPVCPLGVLLCVSGVPGLLALLHRSARPWCLIPLLPSVHACVQCPGPRGASSPVCTLCAVCMCHWWLCPSSSPPSFRFFVFF